MPSTCTAHRVALRLVPLAVVLLGVPLFTGAAAAESAVPLGTAESFAVLAGSGITNTGATTITGDIGSYPTPTENGVDSITLIGTDHAGDAVTQGAKDDLTTAYNDAFTRTPATSIPVELGGTTLLPGVYTSGTFGLTGILTLDSGGDPDASFVFQAGSTLITEVDSGILLVGVDPCRVVWQVGSSATFKTGTDFVGDVLASESITAQTNATFQGRLLASNGAVTLDTNTITSGNCLAAVPDTTITTTTPTTTTSVLAPTTTVPTPTTTTTTAPVGVTTPTTATPTATPAAFAPAGPLAAVPAVPALAAPDSPPTNTLTGTPTGTATAPPSLSGGPPTRPPLPATGTNVAGLLWTALALVAVGGMVAMAGQRRRA